MFRAGATGGGVGYLPVAPGTWGSLEAVAMVWGAHAFFPDVAIPILSGLLILLGAAGLFCASEFSREVNHPDPPQVVIDEIVGQMVTLLWVPITASSLVAGFLLFRLFDILKPFPARQSERFPGGVGIMCDDLVAALYAGLVLRLISTVSAF